MTLSLFEIWNNTFIGREGAKHMDFSAEQAWIQILVLPLAGYMALRNHFPLFNLHFFISKMEIKNT